MAKDLINHALAEDLQLFINNMENTIAMGQGNLPHAVYRPMHMALRELDRMLRAITTTEEDDRRALADSKAALESNTDNPRDAKWRAQEYFDTFKRSIQNKRIREKLLRK